MHAAAQQVRHVSTNISTHLVGRWVALDWDEGAHAADGVHAALVARLDDQLREQAAAARVQAVVSCLLRCGGARAAQVPGMRCG